jgi:hypothetical protein
MKAYADTGMFEATSGKNGCPSSVTQLSQSWDELGFSAGSAMAKGQSCGNETSYVTSAPPENDFDPQWYRKNYVDLQLSTDDEALNDWRTVGQAAGRLPNPNIMKSMTALGMVGYIDPDSVMHGISELSYSGLKSFMQRSNVTGTKMSDCTSLSYVMYGGSVAIAANDKTAYLTTDNMLLFSKNQQHVFIVRPPPNSKVNSITPVRYGDQISLANSTQSSTINCGYYGCKVGSIDSNTWNYLFGPGGPTGGSMLQIMPTSPSYSIGDSVTYGTPFLIQSVQPSANNALFQQENMKPGDRITSSDDRYYFTFRSDGYVVLYQNPSKEVWKSEVGSTKPKQLRITATGNLQAQDTDGVIYWTSSSSNGTPPFALAVQTDGTLVVYDGLLKNIWSKGKSDGTKQNVEETLYATISSDMQLMFTDQPSEQNVFSFQNTDPTKANKSDTCDVTQMQSACREGCVGFIHDGTSNEWQPIMVGGKQTDYKITTRLQDIYLKTPYIALSDKTCKKGSASFIDEPTFSNYVQGSTITYRGKKQCGSKDDLLDAKEEEYITKNKDLWEESQQAAFSYDNSPLLGLQKGVQQKIGQNKDKIEELDKESKKFKDMGDNETYKKQMMDSGILDRQSKSRSIFWAIVAAILVVFISVSWYGGVKAAVYMLISGVVLYLGYRFFH